MHRPDAGTGVGLEEFFGEAEADAQRDQALLGAVVQIAFDARALQVGGLGDAATRLVKFGHRLPEVGGQPLMAPVCEHHAADPVQQLAIVEQGDVMDERDVVATVAGVDGRDGAVGDRLSRPLDRTAARIAPAVRVRVAEEQVGRRVAERGTQRIAHVHAIVAGAQGGAHAAQRPGQQHPPPDQAEEERRTDGDDAQRPH